jgi:hypothetical protein
MVVTVDTKNGYRLSTTHRVVCQIYLVIITIMWNAWMMDIGGMQEP